MPPRAETRVGPIDRSDLGPAAKLLGDAFLADPVWTAIGPRHRGHRRVSNRVSFAGILRASLRHGARVRVARRDGRVAGCSIAFEPGRWPIPGGSIVWELGWLAVAGPAPAARGFRDDRAMRREHVTHPHMYLWFLGVAPELHGTGAGRALLADLHADSDRLGVPTFLETATAENVAFYGRDGYAEIGEVAMPSGPPMWKLERPVGG